MTLQERYELIRQLTDVFQLKTAIKHQIMVQLKEAQHDGYRQGLKDGVRRFAWWKDGTQWCGSGNKTLEEAEAEIEKECEDGNYRQPY